MRNTSFDDLTVIASFWTELQEWVRYIMERKIYIHCSRSDKNEQRHQIHLGFESVGANAGR